MAPNDHGAERPGGRIVRQGHLRHAVGKAFEILPRGPICGRCADVGGESVHRLGGGVGAIVDQPRGHLGPVEERVRAVVRQVLAIHCLPREREPRLEEFGEAGIGRAEGGIALAQGPERASQPV